MPIERYQLASVQGIEIIRVHANVPALLRLWLLLRRLYLLRLRLLRLRLRRRRPASGGGGGGFALLLLWLHLLLRGCQLLQSRSRGAVSAVRLRAGLTAAGASALPALQNAVAPSSTLACCSRSSALATETPSCAAKARSSEGPEQRRAAAAHRRCSASKVLLW